MTKTTVQIPVVTVLRNPVQKPFKLDFGAGVLEGVYAITKVPPMTPISIAADEAKKLAIDFDGVEFVEIDGGEIAFDVSATVD